MINRRFFHTQVIQASRKSEKRLRHCPPVWENGRRILAQPQLPARKSKPKKTPATYRAKSRGKCLGEVKNPFNVKITGSKIYE